MNPIMLYLIKQFYFYKTKRREHINVHAFFSKISFAKRVKIFFKFLWPCHGM